MTAIKQAATKQNDDNASPVGHYIHYRFEASRGQQICVESQGSLPVQMTAKVGIKHTRNMRSRHESDNGARANVRSTN